MPTAADSDKEPEAEKDSPTIDFIEVTGMV
jgi:hypothetical protein